MLIVFAQYIEFKKEFCSVSFYTLTVATLNYYHIYAN